MIKNLSLVFSSVTQSSLLFPSFWLLDTPGRGTRERTHPADGAEVGKARRTPKKMKFPTSGSQSAHKRLRGYILLRNFSTRTHFTSQGGNGSLYSSASPHLIKCLLSNRAERCSLPCAYGLREASFKLINELVLCNVRPFSILHGNPRKWKAYFRRPLYQPHAGSVWILSTSKMGNGWTAEQTMGPIFTSALRVCRIYFC